MNKFFLLFTLFSFLVACGNTNTEGVDQEIIPVEEIISRIKLPEIPDNTFNVMDFGAQDDAGFNSKPAIDAAVAECSAKGGGKVIIPRGNYLCNGPIHLKSNINLHIEEGAVITFGTNPKDYLPLVLVRWEGVEIYNYSPYIYAKDEKNIAVTGKGKFDGDAAKGFYSWRPKQKPSQNLAREMGRDGVSLEERQFGEGHFLRPSFLELINCENILISNFTVVDMPFWIVHPVYCKSVTVRGITVDSRNLNNDGVDPDSSEDVLIEDCRFNTGDDAIAIKAGRDQDAWRVNKPSKNIVVRNCIADTTLHGMALGSEMSGGIENVYVQNFSMTKVDQYALQFKSNKDRGGYIRNIYIDGLKIDTTSTMIYFTNDYHSYSGGNSPTEFHHIEIKNVDCNIATKRGIDMVGLEEKPIHHIHFENVNIKKADKMARAELFSDLSFRNVSINRKNILAAEDLEQ